MAIRITNTMMVNHFNRNLNNNLNRMDKYQMQMATGKSIVRLSDNSVGVIKSIQARARLADIGQYKKNIDEAKSWLTESETALMEMNNIVKRALELTTQIANDTYSTEDRKNAVIELEQLKEQLVVAGNSTFNTKFIFGGYNVTSVPFKIDKEVIGTETVETGEYEREADGSYRLDSNGLRIPIMETRDILRDEMIFNEDCNLASGPVPPDWMLTWKDAEADVIQYEVGQSIKINVSISGVRVMGTGENNLYAIMKQLCEAASDPDRIRELNIDMPNADSVMTKLQKSQNNILSCIAECGGRQNRLDFMYDRYEDDTLNYEEIKSKVEDIDLAETAMYYNMAQVVYNAALATGGRIIQRTLVDFL